MYLMKNNMIKNIAVRMALCISLCLMPACIKNDLPYPTVKLYITGMTVEGQVGDAIISNDERKVTLELDETVNLKKVKVSTFEFTEGGSANIAPDSIIDLTNPFSVTLSLYQDYVWTIQANQNIERVFTVAGQIGSARFYPETREASVNIPKDNGLNNIEVTALKLGPEGATHNGTNGIPMLEWEKKGAFSTSKVRVVYSDFIDEEWTLYVNLTDVKVGINSVDAWTKVAWIDGFGREGETNGCEYKKEGDTDWIKVDDSQLSHDGGKFVARVIHLEPNTAYVCRVYSGEEYSEEVKFTTGQEAQPENNSFEYTSGTSPLYLFGEGQEMWWDTGNTGSSTMGKNVTTVDTSLKQSGNQSLLLSSQFVGIGSIGKFAAGNVFAGKYLKTDGTDGILGFGRPFTSRPTKLKGYIKYNSGVVDKGGDKIPNGQNDIGTVYVALTDGDGVAYDDGSKWSCIIKTKSKQLFDKNADNVVAYGEMILNESTDGEGLIPFEVELDYNSTSRVPTRIMIVASASYYGDYFQGSTSSKMWLDDITLEYDYE